MIAVSPEWLERLCRAARPGAGPARWSDLADGAGGPDPVAAAIEHKLDMLLGYALRMEEGKLFLRDEVGSVGRQELERRVLGKLGPAQRARPARHFDLHDCAQVASVSPVRYRLTVASGLGFTRAVVVAHWRRVSS